MTRAIRPSHSFSLQSGRVLCLRRRSVHTIGEYSKYLNLFPVDLHDLTCNYTTTFIYYVRCEIYIHVYVLNLFSAHRKARCVVERAIGVLKRRFPRIDTRMQYDPVTAGRIIIACVMLHNFAILQGDLWAERVEMAANDDGEEADQSAENSSGNRIRTQYIDRHFSNN